MYPFITHSDNLLAPIDKKILADKRNFFGAYGNPDSETVLYHSINLPKINQFLELLKTPLCWEHPLFQEEFFSYYAVSAFIFDKITHEQLTHILEFHELKKTYPDLITLPILLENGHITELAGEYFLNLIEKKHDLLPQLTFDAVEHFQHHLINNPELGTFYVLYLAPKLLNPPVAEDIHKITEAELRRFLGISNSVGNVFQTDKGDIFLPTIPRNRYYQTITPQDSTVVTSLGRLGKFSLDDMEQSDSESVRLMALPFYGTIVPPRTHDYNTSIVDAMMHDGEHQAAVAYFPKTSKALVRYCFNLLREKTGLTWFHELWVMIDLYLIDEHINIFGDSFLIDPNAPMTNKDSTQWLINLFVYLLTTTTRYIIMEDLANNSDAWQQWIVSDILLQPLKAVSHPQRFSDVITNRFVEGSAQQVFSFYHYLRYQKNRDNILEVALCGVPISQFLDEELMALVADCESETFKGLALLDSACSGEDTNLLALLSDSTLNQSIFPYQTTALLMALQKGHVDFINILLKGPSFIPSKAWGLVVLKKAILQENIAVINYILARIESCDNGLSLAVKFNRLTSLDCLIKKPNKFAPAAFAHALTVAFDKNDPHSAEVLLSFGHYYDKLKEMQNISLHLLLREAPHKCINLIIIYFICENKYYHFSELFAAIAKTGSLRCAKEFIRLIEANQQATLLEKKILIMNSMLKGLMPASSQKQDFIIPQSYCLEFNFNREMVNFQIHHFLMAVSQLNMIKTGHCYPAEKHIIKLISVLLNPKKVYPIFDTALLELINHPIFSKLPQPTLTRCKQTIMENALQHPMPFYLRLILRSGFQFVFTKRTDFMGQMTAYVNNVPISFLPQSSRHLLRLAKALIAIENDDFDYDLAYLRENTNFNDEVLNLIFNNSLPITISTLVKLKKLLINNCFPRETLTIISERISCLAGNSLGFFKPKSVSLITDEFMQVKLA